MFQGSLISVAGATLNTLVQLDPIYVSFNPAKINLAAIMREQARAPIRTNVMVNGGQPNHTGALIFIDNQVSQSIGTILLRATIANPDHELLPGSMRRHGCTLVTCAAHSWSRKTPLARARLGVW